MGLPSSHVTGKRTRWLISSVRSTGVNLPLLSSAAWEISKTGPPGTNWVFILASRSPTRVGQAMVRTTKTTLWHFLPSSWAGPIATPGPENGLETGTRVADENLLAGQRAEKGEPVLSNCYRTGSEWSNRRGGASLSRCMERCRGSNRRSLRGQADPPGGQARSPRRVASRRLQTEQCRLGCS